MVQFTSAGKHSVAIVAAASISMGAGAALVVTPASAATAQTSGRTTPTLTNVRTAANAKAKVVGRVRAGTSVVGTASHGWLRISAPTNLAGRYVALSAVKITKPARPTTSKTAKPAPTKPKPAPVKISKPAPVKISKPAPTKPPVKPLPTPSTPVFGLNTPFACTSNPTLLAGIKGNQACVQAVQHVLNSWMIRTNAKGAQLLTVNGSYGPVTIGDVKLFQSSMRLPVTGQVDAATWRSLAATSVRTSSVVTAAVSGTAGDTHPAFPSTVRLADGRLLLVFTSSKQHATSARSTLWKTYSADGGYSWSTPQPIRLANGMANTVGGLGIATSGPLKGRPILTTWSLFQSKAGKVSDRRTYVTVADDLAGNTWGRLTNVTDQDGWTFTASPIVQVTDTDFQQPVYVWATPALGGARQAAAHTVALKFDGQRFIVGAASVIVAGDVADSAATPASIGSKVSTAATNSVLADGGFTEVGMTKLADGRLLALVRNDTVLADAGIFGSWSSDGGKTWSRAVRLFDGSGVPRMAVTKGGRLVVLYRHLKGPGQSDPSSGPSPEAGRMDAVYRVSDDGGRTWGAERAVGVHSDLEMVYGTPIVNADGTVTFIYGDEKSPYRSSIVTTPNVVVQK